MTTGQRIALAFLALLSWLFFIGAANGGWIVWSHLNGYQLEWRKK